MQKYNRNINRTFGLPEEAPEETPQFFKDYVQYYKRERGYHPLSANSGRGCAATANGSLMNMRLFSYAPEIRSAVLLVHGEQAHSLMYSQAVYPLLKGENKELMIIPGESVEENIEKIVGKTV